MPVVALLAGHPEMLQAVQTAIKVTQNAEKAVAFGSAAARIMEKVGPGRERGALRHACLRKSRGGLAGPTLLARPC